MNRMLIGYLQAARKATRHAAVVLGNFPPFFCQIRLSRTRPLAMLPRGEAQPRLGGYVHATSCEAGRVATSNLVGQFARHASELCARFVSRIVLRGRHDA